MKPILRYILLITLLNILIMCDKDEVTTRNYPRLKTLPVTEITSKGARFNAEIIYRGDFKIENYGFVWSENENPTKENSDRVIYSANIKSNGFSALVETTLKNRSTYFVRPFVETDDFLIYGKNINFLSSGSGKAKIESFMPKTGILADTILIYGNGFSYVPTQNIVRFGSVKSNVISSSDSIIQVIVPMSLTEPETQISVEIANSISLSPNKFRLNSPQIQEVLNDEIGYCEPLNFSVSNFPQGQIIKVHFSDQSSQAQLINETQLQVTVPSFLRNKGPIEPIIEIGNFLLKSGKQLTLKEPTINLEYDSFLSFHDTLTINYSNLSGCQFEVLSEDNNLTIFDRDESSLKVIIPADIDNSWRIPLQITVDGEVFLNELFQRQVVTTSITPSSARPGDNVRIEGRGFQPISDRNYIFFSSNISGVNVPVLRIRCEIIESSGRHIIFKIPENIEDFTNDNGDTYLGIFTQNIESYRGRYHIDL